MLTLVKLSSEDFCLKVTVFKYLCQLINQQSAAALRHVAHTSVCTFHQPKSYSLLPEIFQPTLPWAHDIIISSGFLHWPLPSTGTRFGKNHLNPPSSAGWQAQAARICSCFYKKTKKREKVSSGFSKFSFYPIWKTSMYEAQISLDEWMFTTSSMI